MCDRKLQVKIKIAQKQLGLSDEEYRQALYEKCHVRSSKSLANSQVPVILNYFRSLGWVEVRRQNAPASRGNKSLKYDDSPRDLYDASGAIKRKIEAMWHDLYRGNDETKHLRQWLFNHFHVSDINFLDKRTAYDAVEALKAMAKRHQV